MFRNRRAPVRRASAHAPETLESRVLLSTVTWTGGGDGSSWTDPNNWNSQAVPGAADDVLINAPAGAAIAINAGTQSVHSLVSSDRLSISGGMLEVATSAQFTANLTLAGGALRGGTFGFATGAELTTTISGGTLDGLTINGNIDLTADRANVQVVNGLTLNGTAALGGPTYGVMEFDGTQTLGGNATILFNSLDTRNDLYVPNGPGGQTWTLTLAPTVTVHGISGFVGYDANLANGGSPTTSSIVNFGTIDADTPASGAAISVDGATWINDGTLEAQNGGTLHPLDTWSSNGPLIAGVGSTILLDGALNNVGNVLSLSGAGLIELMGGGITGGTLNFTNQAQLTGSIFGGKLDDVIVNGDIDLTGNKANVQVTNGLTLNGIAILGGVNYGYIEFDGTQTLGGTATVLFNSLDARNDLYVPNGPAGQTWTLTLAPTVTVHGASGYIGYDANLTNGGAPVTSSVIIQGTIDADSSGNGGTISVDGANWINTGTLEAQSGGTIDPLNTWSSTGGLLCGAGSIFLLNGTILNTGNTLVLSGSGEFSLEGGVIEGGTLSFTNGAKLTATIFGGMLGGVTVNGDIDLTADKASLQATGGLTLNGTATIQGVNYAVLQFIGTQTFGGNGQVDLLDQAASELLVQDVTPGQPATLTVGSGVTIHGQGSIGGDPDSVLINSGIVLADVSGKTLQVAVPTFNNQGTATSANGGVLSITSPNTIISSGGNVQISNGISAGTVVISGGDVSFNGTSPVTIQSLTLSGTGVLDGTAPVVISATGNWSGGSLAGSGTLAVAPAATVTVSGNVLALREVDNAGLIQLNSGALALDGGGTQTGSYAIATGASLVIGGSQSQDLTSASGASGAGTFVVQDAAAVRVEGTYNVGATIVAGGASLDLIPGQRVASIGTLTVNGGTFICGNGGATAAAADLQAGPQDAPVPGNVNVLTAVGLGGGVTLVEPGWTLAVGSSGLTFTGSVGPEIHLVSDPITPGRIVLNGDLTFAGSGGTPAIRSIGTGAVPGNIDLGGAGRSFVVNDGSAAVDLAVFANLTDGSLRTSGPGRIQIAGSSAFTGGATLAQGTLEVDDPGALGSGAVDFAGGALALGPGVGSIANALTAAPTDSISIDVGASSRQVPAVTLGSALNVTGSPGGSLAIAGAFTLQHDASINNLVPVTIAATIPGAFAVSKTSTGTLTLGPGASFQGEALNVSAGTLALAPAPTPATDTLRSLTILPGARLDVGNSTLMINYGTGGSPVATIRSYLTAGFAGGDWSGAGLGTDAATVLLAYADSADGVVATLPAHTVVVEPALAGDVNLDGKVDFGDLLLLAQHYSHAGATWDEGDMNYDGTVGFPDLLLLAQHYGQVASAAVPLNAAVNDWQPVGPLPLRRHRVR